MPTPLKALLLSAILLIAACAYGQIHIVNFDFGAVRIVCGGDYAFQWPVGTCQYPYPTQTFDSTPGFGWILGRFAAYYYGGVGLTGPNTGFSPPPFDGMPFNQAVVLQGAGAFVWQAVGGFTPGNYTLSFYLGSRYSGYPYDGNQTVEALLDGHVIGTWALSSYTPFTPQTVSFTVSTGGTHRLMFEGLNPGDHTAFLSYVTVTPTEH